MADDLCLKAPLVWDWDIEHADRKLEAKADATAHSSPPFQVDRKLLKDIVQEKMSEDVVRIKFLGAGTFHKVSAHCPFPTGLQWAVITRIGTDAAHSGKEREQYTPGTGVSKLKA